MLGLFKRRPAAPAPSDLGPEAAAFVAADMAAKPRTNIVAELNEIAAGLNCNRHVERALAVDAMVRESGATWVLTINMVDEFIMALASAEAGHAVGENLADQKAIGIADPSFAGWNCKAIRAELKKLPGVKKHQKRYLDDPKFAVMRAKMSADNGCEDGNPDRPYCGRKNKKGENYVADKVWFFEFTPGRRVRVSTSGGGSVPRPSGRRPDSGCQDVALPPDSRIQRFSSRTPDGFAPDRPADSAEIAGVPDCTADDPEQSRVSGRVVRVASG